MDVIEVSMLDNNILDIIVSIVLIYALLSILVSILTEWVNQRQKARASFLKKTIVGMLNDSLNVNFGELFYNHYLVQSLHNKYQKTYPQYISSKLFAEVLIDIIASRKQHDIPIQTKGVNESGAKQYALRSDEDAVEKDVIQRFHQGLDQLHPSPLTDTLKSFRDKSKSFDELKELIRFWYDDYMDSVSGWFKYEQRWKLRFLGLLVAVALNVDSLHLVKVISFDEKLRNNLVTAAENVASQYQVLSDSARSRALGLNRDSVATTYLHKVDSVLGVVANLNVPIGWDWSSAPLSWVTPSKSAPTSGEGLLAYIQNRNTFSWGNLLYYLLGIFISAFSLSLGAPFWFDTLVKLINIRKAGRKPEAINESRK